MAQRTSIQYVRFYTQGTAARKLDIAVPQQHHKVSLPTPKKVKRRKVYVDPVAILGVVVAVCMLIVLSLSVEQLKIAQEEVITMERYVDQLTQENEALVEEYAHSYDIQMVEQTAMIAVAAGHPSMATSRWVFWMRAGRARTMEKGRLSMCITSFVLEVRLLYTRNKVALNGLF